MTDAAAHHGLFKDTRLHVDDTGGDGRAVVLIHGWPMSGDSWFDQVPALTAAGYRVVTYDRRGFGRSDKPRTGYSYDILAEDLSTLLAELDLHDVTLIGFSMGGGEVARYLGAYGPDRVRSAVFASAVPPYLMHTADNPEGPLEPEAAAGMAEALGADQVGFYEAFTQNFYSADGDLKVTEEQRRNALRMCAEADPEAALACMDAWATTDFRDDLATISVPTLIVHGDRDAIVPLEGSGQRTHAAVSGSQLHVIAGAPHGCTVSHAEEWNRVVLDFLSA